MANFNWPAVSVTASSDPVKFNRNGAVVEVTQDTASIANTRPLPTLVFDGSGNEVDFATETGLSNIQTAVENVQTEIEAGNLVLADILTESETLNTTQSDALTALGVLNGYQFDALSTLNTLSVTLATEATLVQAYNSLQTIANLDFATETTLAALDAKVTACDTDDVTVSVLPVAYDAGASNADTQRVVIATDQAPVATKSPVNTGGSVVNGTLTATTASAETVPANAVGFILQAPSDNTDNIRYRIGGTASTTAGMLMEPGRDTGFIPIAANLSICATVSGTNKYELLWVIA